MEITFASDSGGSNLGGTGSGAAGSSRPGTGADTINLSGYFMPSTEASLPALVVCNNFPLNSAMPHNEALAQRIIEDLGWGVLLFNYRGCGKSEGNFSVQGWVADLNAAVRFMSEDRGFEDIWLAGFGMGGALAINCGADNELVRGVASVSAPADFSVFLNESERFLGFCRQLGIVRDTDFPTSLDSWLEEIGNFSTEAAAAKMREKALLVLHGGNDEVISMLDARAIADKHDSCEIKILPGAEHQLEIDPRAVALLVSWLERQGI